MDTRHWRGSNQLKPKWGMGWLNCADPETPSNLSIQLLKKPARAFALAGFFTPEPPDDLHGEPVMTAKYAIALPPLQGNATTGR